MITFLCASHASLAQPLSKPHRKAEGSPLIERTIAGRTYRLLLAFEESFANLDNWLIESTGTVETRDHQLVWNCDGEKKAFGTIWCRQRFEGPTVVEYDVQNVTGARNLNFILYATHPPQGLLETTATRTGRYSEYHAFPNYIITYLTPQDKTGDEEFSSATWRIRFRKNPGFNLLSEKSFETNLSPDRKQHITHVFDANGTMRLVVDGKLLHEFTDDQLPYRTGYHGFRTWRTSAKYSDFKVFTITNSPDAPDEGLPKPTALPSQDWVLPPRESQSHP